MSRLPDLNPILKRKHNIKDKLNNIIEEKKQILECIENMIEKAESAVQTILKERDNRKFLAAFRSINRYLETCSEKLLEIHIILSDNEEDKLDSYITSLSVSAYGIRNAQNESNKVSTFHTESPDVNFEFVSNMNSNAREANIHPSLSEVNDMVQVLPSELVANKNLLDISQNTSCKGSLDENIGTKPTAQVFNNYSPLSSYHSFSSLSSSPRVCNKDELQATDLKCTSMPAAEIETKILTKDGLTKMSFNEANITSSEYSTLSSHVTLGAVISKHKVENNSLGKLDLSPPASLWDKRDMPTGSQSSFLDSNSKLIKLSKTDGGDQYNKSCSRKSVLSEHSQDFSLGKRISREEINNMALANSGCDTADTQLLDGASSQHSENDFKDQSFLSFPDERKDFQLCVKSSSIQSQCIQNSVIPPFQIEVAVIATFVEDLSSFWLQPKEEEVKELFIESQSIQVSDSSPCLVKGEYYLAPYCSYAGWYRVKLLEEPSTDGMVEVHYIDYGEKVSIPSTSLKTLAPSLNVFPAQAVHCHLKGVKSEEKQTSSFAMLVQQSSDSNSLFAIFSSPVNEQYPVELIIKSSANPYSLNVAQCISTYCEESSEHSVKEKNDVEIYHQSELESARSNSQNENLFPFAVKQEGEAKEERRNTVGDKSFKNEQNKDRPVFFNGWPERSKINLNSGSEYDSSITNSSSCVSQKGGEDGLLRDDDLDVEVPAPEILLLQNNSVPVMVSVIIHPREFYVHISSENSSQLDDLAEQLNNYYNKTYKRTSVVNKSLQIGSYWACQYSADRYWYRVVVLETAEDSTSSELPVRDTLIQYIDYGNKEFVCSKDLCPLPESLARLPAFAVRCALANLRPSFKESGNSESDWPVEAVARFQELTGFEKCFTAEFLSPLDRSEVILWDTEETSINDILVQEGLAVKAAISSETCEHGSVDCLAASWNPMAEDYLNEQNMYEVDMDDPEIAFVGYKAKDEKYICKFFSQGERCYRGERCPYRHIRSENALTLDREAVYTYDLKLDLPEMGTSVLVQVSAVFNPTHFYVIFPYGTIPVDDVRILSYPEAENLDKFVKSMSIYYSSTRLKRSLLPHDLGKIVAARCKFDNQWYRGRIQDINSSQYKVFYVDFGNCDWVHSSDLQEIDPKFLDYPFQAMECRLANVQMKGQKDSVLNKISWKLFRTLTEDKIILADIVGYMESSLLVKLYSITGTTEVSINDELIVRGLAYPEFNTSSKKP